MTEFMSFVRKVAESEATTILVQGESGTGKDLIA
jgi:transcriptional regulator with GAF, ATPase, and Fis domain